MSSFPLRAGVIGLGVGGAHAEGYLHSPDSTLVAFCDSDPARLRAQAEKYAVPAEACFTDYRTMLSEARLDMVSIALPNALHSEVTIAALEAGAHVMCEKPLAPSSGEVRDMMRAARLNDRRLMVAYNHRYRADLFWIRRLIQNARLGQIYHIDAWWRRETGIPGRGWFGSRALAGGGALIDLGVHVLDMSLWLLGFPAARSVSGAVRSHFGPRGQKVWGLPRWMSANADTVFDVDDGGIGFIRLVNDATILLHATWAEHRPPGDDLIRLEIEGTEGSAVLNIPNYTKQDTVRFYTDVEGAPVIVTPRINWDGEWGHTALIADNLRSLREGTPSPTDAVQGLATVAILEGVYQAAQSGREVVFEAQAPGHA